MNVNDILHKAGKLKRVQELRTQAQDDTYTSEQRVKFTQEASAIVAAAIDNAKRRSKQPLAPQYRFVRGAKVRIA